jgi:hypothetical protein
MRTKSHKSLIDRPPILLTALIGFVGASFGAGDPRGPSISPAAPKELRLNEIERWLSGLSSPNWSTREASSQALSSSELSAVPRLANEYRRTESPEVRVRLYIATRVIFLRRRQSAIQKTFLGIAYWAIPTDALMDKANNRLRVVPSIEVIRVLRDTAADHAGFLSGDRIIEFDDRPIPFSSTMDSLDRSPFQAMVESCKPGHQIEVKVLRDEEVRRLTVKLGERPPILNAQESPEDELELDLKAFEQFWLRNFQSLEASGSTEEKQRAFHVERRTRNGSSP